MTTENEQQGSLESIVIYNPLSENFQERYNGELYTIPGKSEKSYAQHLAFHLAKHLADRMLEPELIKLKKQAVKDKKPFNPKNSQLMIYDNVLRRIALWDIFKSKDLVEKCIEAYPFKGFIGSYGPMEDYDKYVEDKLKPKKEEK